jgi:excisionase family DNA binding protein
MILSPLDKRRSIGLAEAARVLGVPARTLRRHAAEGVVPGAFRIGKRRSHWRFRIDLLESWFERQGGGRKKKTEVTDNVAMCKPKSTSPSRPVASG